MFAGKRVLVTGSNGFIGARLVHRLESEGARVFAMVRKTSDLTRLDGFGSTVELVVADLLDEATVTPMVATVKPNYVFNAATVRGQDRWEESFLINTVGAAKLLEATPSSDLHHFVHFGSSFEYHNDSPHFQESQPVAPSSFLGVCKTSGTMLLSTLARERCLPLSILRIFHVYGPGESAHRLVPSAISRLLQDQAVPLTDPGLRHDFVFVDDVVEASLSAALRGGTTPEIYNVGSGIGRTNEEVVEMIAGLLGVKPKLEFGAFSRRPWDREQWSADLSHVKATLGWSPLVTLEDGLKKTIEWCRNG